MTKIDLLQLVDRLEELLERGWRLPVVSRIAIDEAMFLNIIDQMRISIPPEVKLAQKIQRERDRILAQAHEEATQVLSQARENVASEVDGHPLIETAEAEAHRIVREAHLQAGRVRAGADEYAEMQLRELGRQVAELLSTIRNGMEVLEQRRAEREGPETARGASGLVDVETEDLELDEAPAPRAPEELQNGARAGRRDDRERRGPRIEDERPNRWPRFGRR